MTLSTLRRTTAIIALLVMVPHVHAQFLNNTTWSITDPDLGPLGYLQFTSPMVSVSVDNESYTDFATYTENGNVVTITDLPDVGCPTNQVGQYTYALALPIIAWTVVSDACTDRMVTYTSAVWELQGFNSIAETTHTPALSVYPNPVVDEIRFSTKDVLTGTTYTLHDIAGSMVATGRLAGTSAVIPVQGLPAGTYFLHIGNGSLRTKVIKLG